ncbi:hypothetical protein EV178_004638 [Coemansia sp. RSA 1646]|nr:hypothetical protein EV178_004638 [Coemansia sp. RSA 1646]
MFNALELSTDTVSAEPTVPEWLELYDPQTGRVVYANTVRRAFGAVRSGWLAGWLAGRLHTRRRWRQGWISAPLGIHAICFHAVCFHAMQCTWVFAHALRHSMTQLLAAALRHRPVQLDPPSVTHVRISICPAWLSPAQPSPAMWATCAGRLLMDARRSWPAWASLSKAARQPRIRKQSSPRDPNGEWWELVDEDTGVPYYYNSTTGATEWDAPDDATVVPFHTLLSSSVGKRLSLVVSNRGSMAFNSDHIDVLARKASRASLRSSDGRMSRKNSIATAHNSKAWPSPSLETNSTDATVDDHASQQQQQPPPPEADEPPPSARHRSPAAHAGEAPDADTQTHTHARLGSATDAQPANHKRTSAQRLSQSETALEAMQEALEAGEEAAGDEKEERYDTFIDTRLRQTYISHQADYTVPASATIEYFPADDSSGRPRNHSEIPRSGMPGAERMSALDYYPYGTASSVMLHSHRNRSMPSIRADGQAYGMRTFANTQFAAQKRGFLRRKVPLDEMVSYTSEAIARPLLNLPREMMRDAVRGFRVLQRFMGNVDGDVARTDRVAEALWLANRGIRCPALRDEVFCQLAKQITGNPSPAAAERGWALAAVLLYAFRPSQLMFPHLEAFVDAAPIPTVRLRRLLRLQLARAKRAGGRTTEMPAAEMRLAMTVPSRALVFGASLDDIVADPELVTRAGLPRILEQLVGLIIGLGGESTEGLFRIPGDADSVALARLQIEAGNPDFAAINDPNVPASLLKEWLRDLTDPLVPESQYDRCMAAPHDHALAREVIAALPHSSLLVIRYLLAFFTRLLRPSVRARTKMDASNLALVFGPSLLRNPTSSPKDMFASSSGEQRFVLTLIESFDAKS